MSPIVHPPGAETIPSSPCHTGVVAAAAACGMARITRTCESRCWRIAWLDQAELNACRRFNRERALGGPAAGVPDREPAGRRRALVHADRGCWPLFFGARGPADRPAVRGGGRRRASRIYRGLKNVLVRERPYMTHAAIVCAGKPLDRFSFPSGHTLHAVSFTLIVCSAPAGAGAGAGAGGGADRAVARGAGAALSDGCAGRRPAGRAESRRRRMGWIGA